MALQNIILLSIIFLNVICYLDVPKQEYVIYFYANDYNLVLYTQQNAYKQLRLIIIITKCKYIKTHYTSKLLCDPKRSLFHPTGFLKNKKRKFQYPYL